MRNMLFAVTGILGLAAISLVAHGPANAQDDQTGTESAKEIVQAAPKGGMVMIQDDNRIYLYDGSLRKLVITSKNEWGDDGKPITHVIQVDKLK